MTSNLKSSDLRAFFLNEVKTLVVNPKAVVVAVELPTGAIEIITNTEKTGAKLEYYIDAYNDEFKLKANPEVKIVEYMIVK